MLLISDVFVSVVQIHDSVMHRCLFILFGFIFTYRWLQCIHQLSYAFQWLLFDHLFDIYYCVYINSKLLISPTDSEGWGLCRGQQALQVRCGDTLPATCSQVPQPQDTPALVPKPIRLQGCDISSGHYGLRGIESTYFSVFTLQFEQKSITILWGFLFFLFNLPHLDFLGDQKFLF